MSAVYRVWINKTVTGFVDVEADDIIEAEDIAWDERGAMRIEDYGAEYEIVDTEVLRR